MECLDLEPEYGAGVSGGFSGGFSSGYDASFSNGGYQGLLGSTGGDISLGDFGYGTGFGGGGYTLKQSEFYSYIQKTYGYKDNGKYGLEKQVVIKSVSFYSTTWISKFSTGYGDFGGSNLGVGSFNCKVSGKSHRGRITKITNNSIFVAEEGKDYQLLLGDCSNLEVAGGNAFPKVGDNIYWKGYGSGSNKFNIHSALCV